MAKSVIEVKILGDNRDLKRALDDSEAQVDKFSSAAVTGLKVAAAGAALLGGAALIAAPKILEAGAAIEALGVKSATVFGDSLGEVETWAAGVAGSMGLTQSELVGAAAGLGDLLKPMGFTADQAADMSVEMLNLSGALSAWSGGQTSATEAADVLAKAMLGERDGLKALGISISEADVQARLAKNGTDELTGAALEQAKAIATQQLILEKSTDAQAAWNDGSMDGIKAQNESKAAMAELGETMINLVYPALTAILPVVTEIAEWFGRVLPPLFERIRSVGEKAFAWITDNKGVVIGALVGLGVAVASILVPAFIAWAGAAAAAAAATLVAAAPFIAVGAAIAAIGAAAVWAYQNITGFREAVDNVARFFTDTVWPILQETYDTIVGIVSSIVQVFVDNWDTIRAVIVEVFDAVWLYVTTIWDTIYGVISGVITSIQGIINTVMALIKGDWEGVWEGIKQFVDGIWTSISSIITGAIDIIKGYLSTAMGVISGAWGTIWEGIKTRVSDVWEGIKGFVSGGIDAIVGFIGGLPGRVADAIGDGFSALWEAFRDIVNRIIRTWNNLSFTFPSFDGDWNGPLPGGNFTVGGWEINTPNLQELHTGGIVPGARGSERLMMLHTGGIVPGARGSERLMMLEGGERVTAAGETTHGTEADWDRVATMMARTFARTLQQERRAA